MNKELPKISVIIAVYNGAATIARAIDSVLSQTCPAHEIIVIDDGSTDDTATVVKGYADKVRYHYQKNTGVAVARNRGVDMATGEWLAFLDADDWYYPDRLKAHAEWIKDDKHLDFLTGDFDYVLPDGKRIRKSMENTRAGKALLRIAGDDRIIMEGEILGDFIAQHFGDTHTLTLRKETFQRLGGYPAGVRVCEDVNFLIRLTAMSLRIGVICDSLAAYMIHQNSATRSNALDAQRQTLDALLPLAEQLKTSQKYIRKGLKGAIRHARLDLAYTLLRKGYKYQSLRTVVPLLVEIPSARSIIDVASVVRGLPKGEVSDQHIERIMVLTELFLPTKGGTAVWFEEVYRRLGGKQIHIITADIPGAAEHDRGHKNTIHRVEMKRHPWLRPESLAMYFNMFKEALSTGFKYSIQVIHAGRVLPEGLVGWFIARLLRRKIVIYAHGEEITTWRQSAKFNAMLFAYSHADSIIANSDFTRNELLKLGISQEKVIQISPGVDTERFRPGLETGDLRAGIGINTDTKLVLSVGRLSRRKGFDNVIKSLPELLEKGIDVHYAIIGIGEDEKYLKQIARDKKVQDRVHLLGHVSMNDLPRWYNACDVFIMANREINGDTEGFGMVFLEAAACKKPAIAGRAGGTGAAVIDGVTGIRVNGNDAGDIQSALVKLLSDSRFAAHLSEQAYKRAIEEFSWERVAEKTRELVL